MQFQREQLSETLANEIEPLLFKHWEEIAHYKDIKLEPDWTFYFNADKLGMLRIFTARNEEGQLCGYSVYFVKPNPHYKSSIQAVQDILFVDPDHRGCGAKLILWSDEQLKSEGVQATYHHVKSAHNFGPLLERIGYSLVDLIYARRLN